MPIIALALALAAAAPAPTGTPGVRERLAAPVSLNLRGQSLRAAVDALREAAKVDIVLDSVAIQQLGITPEQPVNLDAKDVPARVVLRRLADQYGLDFAVAGGSVVVSTEEGAAARQLRQRVDVDFDRVELAAALKKLSADVGVNLALDPRAEKEAATKVSLHAEDIPLEAAVRLLSEMAGLKPARVGNVLFVTSKAAAAQMRQEAPPPPPKTYEYRRGLIDSFLAPPVPSIVPLPPPGVTPAVPAPESGDRK
jgi:type II secretory pathway component GspD/PulD (secretin)